MKRVYVVGNLLVEKDSLPIKILPRLKKDLPEIDFIEFDPSEDLMPEKEITMIDTVLGIKDATVINDISKFELESVCSLHDFDLGYNLKLMKKFGMIDKVNIIGLPPEYSEDRAVEEVKKLISSLSLGNG